MVLLYKNILKQSTTFWIHFTFINALYLSSYGTLMGKKISSQLSISFYSYVVGVAVMLVLLSSVLLTGVSYAQVFPSNQDKNNTTTAITHNPTTSPLLRPQQQDQPIQPKLHLVKITSPIKGQQVPVNKDLTISGTSADNTTTSDCKVSVIVNGIKPYHDALGNSVLSQADYSKWNFTLTPVYTSIKPGENKITAKFSCNNNPLLISHNSVNVTGMTSTNVAAINNNNGNGQEKQVSSALVTSPTTEGLNSTTASSTSTSPVYSETTSYPANINDNNLRALLVSVHLGKNTLHPGGKQTITLNVADKNSTAPISGASVSGKITGPSGVVKKVEGTTDDKGKASYSWTVHNDYATGKYKVKIEVSNPGYEHYSGSKSFKVTPIPVTISNDNSIKSNPDNSPTPFTVPTDNIIPQSNSPVTVHHSAESTSDNANSHRHLHHNHHSIIISSFSPDTIPTDNLMPQSTSASANTNDGSDTNSLDHPSTIIPSSSDNTDINTNSNNNQQTSSRIGGEKSNDMNSNSLSDSSSSTSLGSNLGIHTDGLAQKIINDVKNKLERQGITIH